MTHTSFSSKKNYCTLLLSGLYLKVKKVYFRILTLVVFSFLLLGMGGLNFTFAQTSLSFQAESKVSLEKQLSPELKEMLQHFDREIYFTENRGQWPAHILYKADFPLGQALVTRQGMMVGAFDPGAMFSLQQQADSIELLLEDTNAVPPARVALSGHGWLLNFVNSSPSMRVSSYSSHPDRMNYFIGRDSKNYATDVKSYKEIWYNDVYDQVDVRYYPSESGSLEYDIICKPGADVKKVAIKLDGIDQMRIDEQGNLILQTSVGDVNLPAPVVYQQANGIRKTIEARYLLANNVLSFDIGNYDSSRPLIIDPIALRWATWVTNNSTGDCHIHGISVDPSDGAIYTISRVNGVGLITLNAFQNSSAGDMDIIVSKYFDPSVAGGTGTRVWQSYFGGSDYDNPYALEQGPDGNLYFTGSTLSNNFPLLVGSAFSGSSIDKRAQSNYNIFISKLNKAGNSVKSAVIGGNNEELAFDLRTTNNGNVIIAGYTKSTNLSTQFSGSGATNTNFGKADVLLFSINTDLSTINWMRNYGGSNDDKARIMLCDPSTSDIYVGGLTSSSNFPVLNPRQNTLGGSQSGFLQKLTSSGVTSWSSYFKSASSKSTIIQCMEFNAAGDKIYFGGLTSGLNSSNISSSGVYSSSISGGTDMFICRMATDQTFDFATYLGGSSNEDNMMGLKLDANENVFVFGYTPSTNFPVTADALQMTNNGYSDKTFSKLNSTLSSLLYSTYYGGSKEDYDPIGQRGIQIMDCKTYSVVTSESNNIPLTAGALTTNKLSSYSTYEPGVVVWSSPPDLSGNHISPSQHLCGGDLPSNFTGSGASFALPDISRNGSITAHPSITNSANYKWQSSSDSTNWTDIVGGNTQNLDASLLGAINQKTYIRRIITGESCNQIDSSSEVLSIHVLTLSCHVTNHVSCFGGSDGAASVLAADGTEPYIFSGPTNGLSAGVHVFTVTDANGCSATCSVLITEPPAIVSSFNVSACDNEILPWGQNVSLSGDYPHSYTAKNGCDSVVTAHVTINLSSSSSQSESTCDSYTWNGTNYTSSGTYSYSTLNAAGCDSTATLNLTIRNSTTSSSTIDVCDSYTWNGTTYAASGTYSYSTLNAAGCDSTATLNLTIRYSSTSSSTIDVCDSYTWNGTNYTSSGMYTYGTTNAAGCDSSATLNLTIRYASSSSSTVDVCDNYTWNGNTYTTSGTYTYSTTNAAGCDSTATLNLTIRYSSTSSSTIDVCDSYSWNGTTYTSSGTYSYSTLNAAGCDSTATLNLTIRYSSTSSSTIDVCDSYSWNGTTYTSSGTYSYSTLNAAGCDSTATLNLTIRYSSTSSSTIDVCDSYTWNGTTYAASGTYSYSTLNAAGCDSTATLNLTIRYSSTSSSTIDVCDSYTWNGNTYTTSGTYTNSTTNAAGCDSTATLNLTIRYSSTSSSNVDVCDTYTWNGNTYTTSGTYTYSTTNAAGCDSTATLNLTIRYSSTSSSNVDVCDTYTWNGNTYTTSGTYTYSTTNAAGCDSTATLNLTIRYSSTSSSNVDVCDTYTWNGNTYTTSGTYTYSTTNAAGCDSTATLNLTIRYSSTSSSSVDVCDTYTWNGTTYTASGTYSYSTINAAGCDSTATLNLTIRNSTTSSSTVSACNNYTWINGTTYTASGTYSYSTLNAAGCDSTATLNLTIRNSTTSSSTASACNNYTWINGTTYTASGTYSYSTLNAAGCDSTATLNLTIRNSTTSSSTVSACNNYTWNGTTYTASGTYSYSTLNAAGCDSTATLNLTIRNSTTSSSTVSACNNYTWINGTTYTASGTYSYSTLNAAGCDSTATLNLTIRNSTTSSSTVSACNNYTWINGTTYTASGTYSYSTLNAAGCDSTATLNLTIRNSTTSSSTVSACNNYTWNGTTYTASGTYSYSTLNAAGCDSTATLNLTIRNSTTSSSTVSACNNYTWINGTTYTASGTYSYSTLNAAGCDSTATLNLTIRNSTTSSSTVSACNNYTWNGTTYTASGTYSYSTLNAAGCDSTATLNLTIRNSTTSSSTVSACNNYTWINGTTYTASGTYSYSTLNAAGCDSTATLNLTIRNSTTSSSTVSACNNYTWNGTTYTASGTYSYSTLNAAGCDSTATLNLTIRNSTTSSSTVSACNNYTWINGTTYTASGTYSYSTLNAAGCDSTATLNLTIRNSTTSSSTVSACNNYTWNGTTYTASGTYSYSTLNAAGCDSTSTLNLIIYSPIIASASSIGEILCHGGTVDITFNISGGTAPYVIVGDSTDLSAGTYTFSVTDANGCTGSCSITLTEPDELVATVIAVSPINCFGGSTCVTVNATGGTGSYTGTGNICGIMAGVQNFVVTDANSCSSTASITLSEPSKIEIAYNVVLPNCSTANGSVSATVSGGVSPYSYSWSDGQTTAIASGLLPGLYTLTVTDAHGCVKACSVTVSPGLTAPPTPGAISGSTGVCRSTIDVVYSIEPVSTAISYNWTLPAGATGSSNGTSITLSFSSTYNGGFICVEAVNSCGASSTSCMNIPVLTVKPAKPGPISGPAITCGPAINTYSIIPVANATYYNWTVSGTGVSIMSGQGTTTIQVSVPSTFGQGVIGVSAQNCKGSSALSSMYITGYPQHSSPLFGLAYVCPNTSGVNYNISVITGTAYYVWEVISGDMAIFSQSANTCVVDFGPAWTSGILRVTTYNACGGFSRDYTIRSVPTQPLSIAGPSTNLCNVSGVTYSISPVAAASGYTWTVPAGASIVLNNGTSIVVDFGPAFTGSGNICVTADNACGQSVARCYNVSSRPPQSGVITGPLAECKSHSSVLYSILPVAGATSYSWSITGGPTLIAAGLTTTVNFSTSISPSATLTVNTANACGLGSPTRVTILVNMSCRQGDSGMLEDKAGLISAYPNPSNGSIDISLYSEEAEYANIELMDLPGQILSSADHVLAVGSNTVHLDLSGYAKGIYLLKVRQASGKTESVRLVLE